MRRVLLVAALTFAVGCGGGGAKPPAGGWQQLAASEPVKVLKDDDSPDRIIYNPPVDLAKR